ncbi:NAD(P)/FAD-dependent oxidoreductase [Primorskyibacter flagellatus]|uniref:Glycine/D-amino acid oxidase n=1 Tax=Primorskyibacter flagellatus TaxID=1387277 RepID=A0A1W2C816_9RHOB|nr:FAD-binding oxidoreductase [Primorskyibacter flagellatus]SMC81002.1 Glycine/D-amino acid oxidase [Primorskyibacter flagellatus]
MTDFLIIGGGIAGVSAAARLSELGSVTLLEAEDALSYHASGRSAAAFLENYGNDVVRALNRASADHLHNANGGVLSPRGQLLVGGPDEADSFSAQAVDFGLTEISATDARAKVPILNPATATRAAWRPDVFDLDTDLLLQNFLREARGNGAEVVTRARISAISRKNGRWRVSDGAREWTGTHLVNAAGAWADQIAALAGIVPLGIQPYRRSMARLPAPGGHDVQDWPFFAAVDDRWYAKPDAGALLVSPSEADPMEPHDAWADDMVLAEGLARYEEMVTAPVTRVLSNWAGLRSFAPDHALVVGADPAEPEFIWVAGQGGYGFQTCAAVADLVAQLLNGTPPVLDATTVAALSPARFR